MLDLFNKSDEEWKKELTPEQYRVLRKKGTEAPFTGEYTDTTDLGNYHCAGCDHLLFNSEHKFHSGCGWPSFWGELESAEIKQVADNSHGMVRTELVCSKCDGHLGHIFNDGPAPSFKRYCINSISMTFKPTKT